LKFACGPAAVVITATPTQRPDKLTMRSFDPAAAAINPPVPTTTAPAANAAFNVKPVTLFTCLLPQLYWPAAQTRCRHFTADPRAKRPKKQHPKALLHSRR
jgi:hypothetical protein